MQPSRPSLGIYPRLLLFGRIPRVCTYRCRVYYGTSAESMSNVLYAQRRVVSPRERGDQRYSAVSLEFTLEITIARH